MNDNSNRPPDDFEAPEGPVAEIKDLRVEPHPELEGRVRRDINRRTLAGDSLDFSLNVMLHTFWTYLRSIIESLPGPNADDRDRDE